MAQPEIYDILADLASDRPTEASAKFRELLDKRAEEAVKAHVSRMKLDVRDEEPTPDTSDQGPSAEDVTGAKTLEQEAWEKAQNPSEIESTPDGLTDDHQVPIA